MNYQKPCNFVRIVNSDYLHINGRVRQKMSMINHLVIKLNIVSGLRYNLYIDDEYILLCNMTLNKVIFTEKVIPTFGVVMFKLEQLITMHEYEHKQYHTIYERNHYLSLKQQYYG